MTTKKIVINGKFIMASLEGMPRVGREILSAFDELLSREQYRNLSIEILAPKGARERIKLKTIKIQEVGHTNGFIWEQIYFPMHAADAYTINFTSTAPIIMKNGCVVVHDAQFLSSKLSHSWKTFILYGIVTRIVSRRYRTIVTVSEYAKNEILDYKVCDRKDIQVIYNSADHVLRREHDNSILKRFGLTPGRFLLANSYVHHHKNIQILFSALKLKPFDGRLVLFGSSGRENYVRRGIDVPQNVTFVGRVTDEQLVSLMSSANSFLFPSTTEGFGLPPLESMMLGCPTVCSNNGAMPEICGDGALYAPPYSAQAWRDQIDLLWADDDARNRLSILGKKRAEHYSWLESAKKYLDIFSTAIQM